MRDPELWNAPAHTALGGAAGGHGPDVAAAQDDKAAVVGLEGVDQGRQIGLGSHSPGAP